MTVKVSLLKFRFVSLFCRYGTPPSWSADAHT